MRNKEIQQVNLHLNNAEKKIRYTSRSKCYVGQSSDDLVLHNFCYKSVIKCSTGREKLDLELARSSRNDDRGAYRYN